MLIAKMRQWRWQYLNYARAESLRRAHGVEHDIVIRARLGEIAHCNTVSSRPSLMCPTPMLPCGPRPCSHVAHAHAPMWPTPMLPCAPRPCSHVAHAHAPMWPTPMLPSLTDVLLEGPILIRAKHIEGPLGHIRLDARNDSVIYALGNHVLKSNDTEPMAAFPCHRPSSSRPGAFLDSWKAISPKRGSRTAPGRHPSPWGCDGANATRQTRLFEHRSMCSFPDRCPSRESERWAWLDWLFVGTPAAMAALVEMRSVPLLWRSGVRCIGLCQEEQLQLQLEKRGTALVPLPAAGVLVRLSCQVQHQLQPLLLSSQASPSWNYPCRSCD